MHQDERGHALTTASSEAAAELDLAIHNFLTWKADVVRQAERVFRAAHRPDPNWPLDRRADAHVKSAKEAWAVKRQRDKTKWAPPNAVQRP